MSREFMILYNSEKCIQCSACETACKAWRGTEPGINLRQIKNIWKGKYPDIKMIPVSISCMHCTEPACINACPVSAIKKDGNNGLVLVDRETCTGCRACLDACPYRIPQFGNDGTMQKCDMCSGIIDMETQCPPCVQTCPTGSLLLLSTGTEKKTVAEKSLLNLLKILS